MSSSSGILGMLVGIVTVGLIVFTTLNLVNSLTNTLSSDASLNGTSMDNFTEIIQPMTQMTQWITPIMLILPVVVVAAGLLNIIAGGWGGSSSGSSYTPTRTVYPSSSRNNTQTADPNPVWDTSGQKQPAIPTYMGQTVSHMYQSSTKATTGQSCCPQCGSFNLVYNSMHGGYVCYHCGNIISGSLPNNPTPSIPYTPPVTPSTPHWGCKSLYVNGNVIPLNDGAEIHEDKIPGTKSAYGVKIAEVNSSKLKNTSLNTWVLFGPNGNTNIGPGQDIQISENTRIKFGVYIGEIRS